MNALTEIDTLVEDKLFATLDTKTSVCKLENGEKILMSDTVGFIKNCLTISFLPLKQPLKKRETPIFSSMLRTLVPLSFTTKSKQ